MTSAPIVVERVNHWFGEGELRKQVLFDVSAVIREGEVVLLTGPSGSGKTTLLTLIGALRSAQDGSVGILGRELRGADEGTLTQVRSSIGYVFQSHNLLDALTVRQNVEVSLQVHAGVSVAERQRRAATALAEVGLGDLVDRYPARISGGQRQRVAIARALVGRPRILLADEPTAALDRETGREVVDLIQRLARDGGVTVLLVTHDHRILDIADRVLALEDGRLSSFMSAVTDRTRHLMGQLAHDIRHGELVRRVGELAPEQFHELLGRVTEETRQLVDMLDLAQGEAFENMLAQVFDAFANKVRELVGADHAAVYLVDDERGELWSVEPGPGGVPSQVSLPLDGGVAGRVVTTGRSARLAGGDVDPARAALGVPVLDSDGRVFAVVELRGARGRPAFGPAELEHLERLAAPLGLVLDTWSRLSCGCMKGRAGTRTPCTGGRA